MLSIFRGKRPDITPAQVLAGIPIGAELLHAFGVYDLSQAQQDSLGKAVTWAFVVVGGDAAIRIGRNMKDAAVESAALTPAPAPAQSVPGAPVEPPTGGPVPGDRNADGIVDEEERALLADLDGGVLPTDDAEFATPPGARAVPDDPDAGSGA